MLINNFFEILETSGDDAKMLYTIKLDPAHEIYSGHFPNNPITPGVVQMQLVKEILEHRYKKELKLLGMSRCKFLKILNPIETPVVTIEITPSDHPLHVSAAGVHGEDVYFKLSATFSDEP